MCAEAACIVCDMSVEVPAKRMRRDEDESSSKKPRFSSPYTSDESLLEKLDLSGIKNEEQLLQLFNELAHLLLFQYSICLSHNGKTESYELLEIEFYWNNHTWHSDPFCHSGPHYFCEWCAATAEKNTNITDCAIGVFTKHHEGPKV